MHIQDILFDEYRIEAHLKRLAASDDIALAWRGQQLLDLVRQLEAQGSDFEVHGVAGTPILLLFPTWHCPASWSFMARIDADWYDRAPLKHGRPEMHYRLRVRGLDDQLGPETRTNSPEAVERVVMDAFADDKRPIE